MKYKHSVWYPDQMEVEHSDKQLSATEVKTKAENYPWKTELLKFSTLNYDDIYFNPALEFVCLDDKYSLCLRAEGKPERFSFSVWYNRPRMKKVFFGFLGKKPEFEVVKKPFSQADAFRLLDLFFSKYYLTIEKSMQ